MVVQHQKQFSGRKLVVLGVDGAGKSTAIRDLVQTLEAENIRAQRLPNVSGRRWLNRSSQAIGYQFPKDVKDRIEVILRVIIVALNSLRALFFPGFSVMDRHLYCQLVLRRVRGLPDGLVLPRLAAVSVRHSQIVLLDLDAPTAHSRITARGEDSETLDYLRESRAHYLDLASVNAWPIIDAFQSRDRVVAELRALLGR